MSPAGDSSVRAEHQPDVLEVASVRIPLPRFSHKKLMAGDKPYVERWMVELKDVGSVRLHHWLCSDDQRAFHDHPWWFCTLVLKGDYYDRSPATTLACLKCGRTDLTWNHLCPEHGWIDLVEKEVDVVDHLTAGSVRRREARHRHTVIPGPRGAWTLLVTGPEIRQWGFWVKGKFRKRNRYFYDHGRHVCDR